MHVPTLYLDTSVIGGYFDDEWCASTRDLWQLMETGCCRFIVSQLTNDELLAAPAHVREHFKGCFPEEARLPVTNEALDLADIYIHAGILTEKYADDALHVAVCTLAGVEWLLSWNFRHLVQPMRRDAFNALNRLHGFRSVRIVSPREYIYGTTDH